MRVLITDWALQSYLELRNEFTVSEYREILRPDVELLKKFPKHEKFKNSKFWGPCKNIGGRIIHQGYKMKWHNIGSGGVQLRLLVVLNNEDAYLCNAYVKENEKKDFHEMAKLKLKIQLINEGKFVLRGNL